jgi:hypothetical protein
VWGGPTAYESRLDSPRSLSSDELLRLVDVVRGATRQQGAVQEVLGALEWKTIGELSEIAVTAAPGAAGTRVRVLGDRGAAAALTWGLSVAGGLVAGGITGAVLEPATVLGGVGILAAAGTAGVGLARALWARSTGRFQRRFTRLSEELSQFLNESLHGGEPST